MIFRDRSDAGRRLGAHLAAGAERFGLGGGDVIVLGLPRGGVPVAAEVAAALDAPLDVVVVRKLGMPGNDEIAMGAIGDGVRVIHDETVAEFGISSEQIAVVEDRERIELARRLRRFRGRRPPLDLAGKIVIVVDDGIATGATVTAACEVVRTARPARIVVAVPVAPPEWGPHPGVDADEFVCLERPPHFFAIGQWYTDFTQTSDEEVAACLARFTR